MAKEKKSIIEEALLEAKTIEDALKANTKEILASTMKEEIDSVVRESLAEQVEDEEIENDEIEGLDDEGMEGLPVDAGNDSEEALEGGDEEGIEPEMELDSEFDAEGGEEAPMGDEESELPMEIGDELEGGEELEGELGDEEGMMGDLEGLDDLGGEEMDLTMSGDDEVLKVFKSMSDDDEIEVVKDADGISLKDNQTGAEYYIKESDDLNEDELCEDCGDDDIVYEVELDEEMAEMYLDETEDEDEDMIEEDKTLQRRHGQRKSGAKVGMVESRRRRNPIKSKITRKPVTESKDNVRKESYEKLLKEYKVLKGRNEEYKEALKVFKTKINEVALFNQNLAHVTKIFTEHSTTKKEKMGILGRFDSVDTIKESKSLYKSIEAELGEKTPITETVTKKVNKTIDSSKSNLNESTAYVDPQINAIKDLMKRIEK